ncbi:NTP pyrophosphohydrolase with NUDIX domain [Bifidobacterium dolichotidis]|uniref:8-oxo-dGTP diphosphatase n=1 Tax=Bifidobacterium dolichotidis TaxID=2306976 RepID=A0A430FP13_9BIFI|nr:(deoxy)nucleoside triphosphate pyrophosphohydrolase [Bifidobacterium dolichotidis]RSX54567.1 NTP pyrophosphohydrolase with NUDIX domain [Bifidobacterium dolichotidis]
MQQSEAQQESRPTKFIDVVGAAIVRDGLVLCGQRGPGKSLAGFWEFPGGKIEAGETPREALQREIEEELRCEIHVDQLVCSSEYDYDFGHVRLTTFICHLIDGTPHLTEHKEIRWVQPSRMPELNWAPVDARAVELISAMKF